MHDSESPHDSPSHDAPSRSQRRREALDVLQLAATLAGLSPAQLARVPLTEDLRAEVQRTRAVSAHIARKRQTQYLAKQLRSLDEPALAAIRGVLGEDRGHAQREAAALHRSERWRERLLDEGDGALADFIAEHPAADRQQLRQLVRNALRERAAGNPPHAQRELFRMIVRAAQADAG